MKLQSLMEKGDEKMVKCPECGNEFGKGEIQKMGLRKNKREELQKYFCKKCRRHFVMKKMLNKSYPVNVILNSISFYNQGMTLAEASKKINSRFGVKTYPKLISSWMNEFSDICTFKKFRDKIREKKKPGKSGFTNPVFEKLIEHKQPYLYKCHRLKSNMFLNDYFSGLRDYLFAVVEICPHELFLKENARSSQVKINYGNTGNIWVEKKYNYACKLAELALKMARTNKARHQIIQDFMLINDTSTLAVEVPVWMSDDEVKEINKEFGIFSESCGNEHGFGEITGHIDFVQARYGIIYVLDYKPEAERVDAVSQLFTYALALSIRTDIWLRNFRCAWFDEKAYYEFNPNDIILACISEKLGNKNIPEEYLKKYVLNERAKHHYTSEDFHEKYVNEKLSREYGKKIKEKTVEKTEDKKNYIMVRNGNGIMVRKEDNFVWENKNDNENDRNDKNCNKNIGKNDNENNNENDSLEDIENIKNMTNFSRIKNDGFFMKKSSGAKGKIQRKI